MMRHEKAADAGRRAEALDVRRLPEEKETTDAVGPPECVSYQRFSTTKRHIRVLGKKQAVARQATKARLLSAASCSFGDASQRILSSIATVSLVRSLSVCSVTLVLTSSSGAVDMLALTEVPPPISVDGTRGFTLFLLLSNSDVTYANHNGNSSVKTSYRRQAALTYDSQQRRQTLLTYLNCNNCGQTCVHGELYADCSCACFDGWTGLRCKL
jgi:hypothetical protein